MIETQTPDLAGYAGQVALSLLLVLALIFLVAWGVRRLFHAPLRGEGIRVLSAISVGRREKILLIEVGRTQLLVGVTESRVSTLHVLEEPLKLADNDRQETGRSAQRFEDVLRNLAPFDKKRTGDHEKKSE